MLSLIEHTVHAAKPGLPLGFMTGDRFFEGYDFDRWAEVLAGPNRAPVYWRPGGGFYEDSSPGGLVGKSHDVETLNVLNRMGFQELTGMSAGQSHPVDCIEEFRGHAQAGLASGAPAMEPVLPSHRP